MGQFLENLDCLLPICILVSFLNDVYYSVKFIPIVTNHAREFHSGNNVQLNVTPTAL